MSIEYSISFQKKLSVDLVRHILNEISKYPGWSVVKSSDSHLQMRSLAKEQRTDWPEDIEIKIDQGSFYLAFHSATRQERNELISFIHNLLKSYDIDSELEEL